MHTTSLRTQAYVCARIFMPRNPNLNFPVSSACLFYLTCLHFNLLLCFLYFFKHVRLLDLSFQVLLCFFACLFFGLGFRRVCIRKLEVCVRIQLAYVYRPMYTHTYLCSKTLILIFLFLLLCLFYLICLYFNLLICFSISFS